MSVQFNAEKRSLEKEAGGPDIEPVLEGTSSAALNDVDEAYHFAKEYHAGPLTQAENRRILNKVDRHLLPMVRAPHFMLVTMCWRPPHVLMHVPAAPAPGQQARAVMHRENHPAGAAESRLEHRRDCVLTVVVAR